ncbi:DoxX family protein [Roseisolibacter sp. H3M3-2]|uniref:DoxX family protein n=1 Tax=Roseisolibacter sp. H3M3-2 TaxID=3031323 RepID=UPI0023DBD1B5|nr:DoxX family protein [Roseisolibacter sp. H3M3-2]MDF1502395.1 DoxX family protein [Roseisolibacter sp. H3M3-2]
MTDRRVQIALALLRISSGVLFFQHAFPHLFGTLGGYQGTPGRTAEAFSRSWVAGVLELVGGPLLVLGLFTRPVAFVLSGTMAFAYFLVHAPRGPFPIVNRGEPPALYAFIFLFLAAAGAGAWSVDGWLARRRAGSGAAAGAAAGAAS